MDDRPTSGEVPGVPDPDGLGLGESLTEREALPAHVYLHVPFCRSKCSYCDFASVSGAEDGQVLAVFEAMRSEVRRWAVSALPGVIDTVYVGGGTPSFVAGESARLLDYALRQLPVREDAEVTVEANPDSFEPVTARGLRRAGATRVSLGVQSFDDSVLRMLGRPHDATRAAAAVNAATEAALDVSVDLMCGVPGQSISSWQETLDRVVRSGVDHVSVYPLSVEEGTPLAVAISAGLVDAPDPDDAATMMILAEEVLSAAGLPRYEVANYARPGWESRHNLAYWTGRPYLGIGPAAHGMLDAATAGAVGLLEDPDRGGLGNHDVGCEVARVRYRNVDEIDEWLYGTQWEIELLSADEVAREDVMLGLRLTRGVPERQVEAAGLTEVLTGLRDAGLTELVDSRWRTTDRGWLLGNEVFGRVWAGE